jgi:hypothetical protein
VTIKELEAAAATIVEAEAARRCLDELMGSMAGCFRRREPRAPAPADSPQPVPNAKGVREMAFWLCFVPEGRPVTLRTLVKVAGRR